MARLTAFAKRYARETAKHEDALEALRTERAAEIRAAIDAGVPRVEIARQLDLSPQRLRRILRS